MWIDAEQSRGAAATFDFAVRGDERLFGLDASCCQDDPGWELLRSFKRQLAMLGPTAQPALGSGSVTALALLTAFLIQLRRDLVERSNLRLRPQEALEAVIAVPAPMPTVTSGS